MPTFQALFNNKKEGRYFAARKYLICGVNATQFREGFLIRA
jgi:hypothetical protein